MEYLNFDGRPTLKLHDVETRNEENVVAIGLYKVGPNAVGITIRVLEEVASRIDEFALNFSIRHSSRTSNVRSQRANSFLVAERGKDLLGVCSERIDGDCVQPPQSGPLIWFFSSIVSGIGGRMPSA